MSKLEAIRDRFPEAAKDIKLNLQTVLQPGSLSAAQRWGVAIASAIAARNTEVRDAIVADAAREVEPAVIDDAAAAAALMAMNNVYYRFRHFMNKEKYNEIPARVKMNIMARPVGGKEFFELMSLAVSAVNGCEMCVKAHENSLIELGSKEERIFEAVRLGAVITSLSKVVF